MKKVQKLLKVTDYAQCTAQEVLHLLTTTDLMSRVPESVPVLQKRKKIVNVLHFKTEIIEHKVLPTYDALASTDFLDKINNIKAVLDADDQIIIEDSIIEEGIAQCS